MNHALFALAAGLIALAGVPGEAFACGPRRSGDPAPQARTGCARPPATMARLRLAIISVEPLAPQAAARFRRCRVEAHVLSATPARGRPIGPRITALTTCAAESETRFGFDAEELRPGREILADYVLWRPDVPGLLTRPVQRAAPQPDEARATLQLRIDAVERLPGARCAITARIVTVVHSELRRTIASGDELRLVEACVAGERSARQASFSLGDIAVGSSLQLHLNESGGELRADWRRPYVSLGRFRG